MNDMRQDSIGSVFEKEFPVHFHELGHDGCLGPVTLLNFMQTSASLHANQLGVSAAHLRPKGVTWVISRIHLMVDRYPRARESVFVRTWPALREGFFTCRDFELWDGSGQHLGRASTSWALISIASRRPVKLEGNLPPYPLLPVRALEDSFEPLPQFSATEYSELTFRVLRGNLDLNNHVNNTVYAGWALETAPDEIAGGSLTELEIAFRAEVLYGDTVISRCSVEESGANPLCLHQIVNQRDGRELARLRTRWKDSV